MSRKNKLAQIGIYKRKAGWEASHLLVAALGIEREQYQKLVAEWAEVLYLHFCQLPENSNSLALELLPSRINAEKVEMQDAA